MAAPESLLAGLVDLARRGRFRERKFRVLDHHTTQQRDEEDAQKTADDHQGARFGPCHGRGKVAPTACHDERGKREHGPGGDRLADRAHGSGDVLLEDGTLEQTQHGHPNDGCRIGGGNRHAGPEPEIRVRRSKDHGHDQAENDGTEGHFPQVRLLGDERDEATWRTAGGGVAAGIWVGAHGWRLVVGACWPLRINMVAKAVTGKSCATQKGGREQAPLVLSTISCPENP